MKPITIKVDFLQLAHLSKSVHPNYVGTAVLILIAVYQKNYQALQSLAPSSNPVVIKLQDLGWLNLDNGFKPVLTEVGNKLVKTVLVKQPKEKKINERSANVKEWIADWINMWPKGVKQPSTNKFLVSDPKNLTIKMQWFVEQYDYTIEEIKAATKQYLFYHHSNSWQTVRQATYFIFKEDSAKIRNSDLATWCEAVRNKPGGDSINRMTKSIN